MRIKELRLSAGLLQKQLFWDEGLISKIETGKAYPSERDSKRIAEALGCREIDLYTDSDIEHFKRLIFESLPKGEEFTDHTARTAEKGICKSETYVLDNEEQAVLDSMGIGREKAVHTAHITVMTGIKGRQIRKIVATLRCAGIPICSSTEAGYWLTNEPQDLERTIKTLEGWCGGMIEATTALRRTLEEMRNGRED